MNNALARKDSEGAEANPELLNAICKASEQYNIVASRDIVDVRGLKLWAKGQPVSAALQQRLLDRKLAHPLEACLNAENGVTLFSLHDDLRAYLEGSKPLARALRPWSAELLQWVQKIPLHSVAQLLLTTAKATRPHSMEHVLESMALAGAIASEHVRVLDPRLAMLGGLLHDIGEVYIQPQYLDDAAAMDMLGHKHLVVHPRVAELLLRSTTDYPDALCRAIGEHHERLDGTGYPARLQQEAISPLGRLLSVVEVTLGVVRRRDAPLASADFALRAVHGEFDPRWTSFIFNLARAAGEVVRLEADTAVSPAQALEDLGQRLRQTQQLALEMKMAGCSGPSMAIVDTALQRTLSLSKAWNAFGVWGLDNDPPKPYEQFELGMAHKELRLRIVQLQRECMLLAERVAPAERSKLAPLWDGLLAD